MTPLRYPGGKGRLGPWLAQVLRHNKISGGWYVEPYAGGAGAAFYLLMQGFVDHIVINDADPVIYAFWQAATRHTNSLIQLIKKTPVSMQTWEKQRVVIANPNQYDIVEVGFAAFFLNRTNRSGILSAGVIGGKNQTGPYKLDARFNETDLLGRIEKIGAMTNHITVLGLDAVELLTNAGPGFPEKCLVYLDPPYYVKGSLLYRNHYQPEDHFAVAESVLQATYPVIVTYDDCPEIRDLYKNISTVNFELHYSTHVARPKASEALFYKNLTLPTMPEMTRRFHLSQQARTKQATLSQNVLIN
jgi:DNA adenine methylase